MSFSLVKETLRVFLFITVGYLVGTGAFFIYATEVRDRTMCEREVEESVGQSKPRITLGPLMAIEGRELVLDTGMENTVVVSVLHLYDDYAELNLDYQTFSDQKEEEVWGWSDCEWQPEQNYAACDIYTIRPTYVHAEMAFDTLGHEVWHGVAGDFHPDE